MLVLFLSACLIGTVKDLEAELAQLEEELEDLEDEVDELESVDSSADDSGLDDSGGGDSGEEWVMPVSVVFSMEYTKLSDGSYDYRQAWVVEGDYLAARTTVYNKDGLTTTEESCMVLEYNESADGQHMVMVETWGSEGYQCWTQYIGYWPGCKSAAQVASRTCDS